jgi:hypothetical protein
LEPDVVGGGSGDETEEGMLLAQAFVVDATARNNNGDI